MSHKQENSEQIEISISEENGELSEKKTKFENLFNFFGHSNRSTTSLGDADDDIVEKLEIIKEKIEEHRTLLLINKKDQTLYKEINNWVYENPESNLEDTILKFNPEEYHNSDALAKVVFNYSSPDFIIRYKDNKDDDDLNRKQKKRENFEILLLRTGLILEHEIDTDGIYTYLKIIAPFDILCEVAREIKLKIRINKESLPDDLSILDQYYKSSKSKIFSQFTYKIDLKKQASLFNKDCLRNYEGAEPGKNIAEIALHFFNTSRRNLLVHRVIITAAQINKKITLQEGKAVYVKRKVESLEIKKLLNEGVYDEFYPIHDGPAKIKKDSIEKNNLRAQLNELWVKGSFRRQPIDKIREYFGEKMALYFAWLGFYTSWLSVASIAGIIVVIYGLIYAASGKFEKSSEKFSAIWDNALTAPYALIMAIWATCFLETWKRFNSSIQYDWDVMDYEKDELPRPEFYGTTLRTSLITLKKEIHFPYKKKLVKIIISIIIVLISIGIVIVTVVVLIKIPAQLQVFKNVKYVAPVITAIINLATIIILNLVYKNVARFLTNFENHKTETQFEDSLILKAYLFDFVNFYSALIYIMLNGDASCRDSCHDTACIEKCIEQSKGLTRLTIQLAIIFIGKQLIGQIQEILIPWLLNKWNSAKSADWDTLVKKYADSGRKNSEVPQWVEDDHLPASDESIMTEYEEMVIQFGFLALFGVAFPLAPLFAWINNITEIRSDAFKYIKALQRPVGHRAEDLGMWEKILTIISFIAVLTNAIIIAFHSIWMENQFKKYTDGDNNKLLVIKLGFVLAFEHFVFIIKLIFAYTIPDVSETVKIAIERERYLSRLVLEGDVPALDEYWSDNKDDSSIFSKGGSILLPRKFAKYKAQ
ncbi:calcium-activated chloride channel-domain-containing protein [Glomus cerebriforme]|uniref:Calcium-activated chloride channel-domain-containing protein n=1 Tax=Glomus cerebriforme TaxID=658196 RepID=A0A397SIM9_9GLOM|nr:calcium-activated chloride channel-domain-containing protein [Glomus cerebriforme]